MDHLNNTDLFYPMIHPDPPPSSIVHRMHACHKGGVYREMTMVTWMGGNSRGVSRSDIWPKGEIVLCYNGYITCLEALAQCSMNEWKWFGIIFFKEGVTKDWIYYSIQGSAC